LLPSTSAGAWRRPAGRPSQRSCAHPLTLIGCTHLAPSLCVPPAVRCMSFKAPHEGVPASATYVACSWRTARHWGARPRGRRALRRCAHTVSTPARRAAARRHLGWAAQWLEYEAELRANLSEPALTVPVFDDAARPCLVQAPTLAVNQPGAVAAPACASKRVSSRNSWHPSGSQTGRELQAIGVLPMQPPMTMGSPLNR